MIDLIFIIIYFFGSIYISGADLFLIMICHFSIHVLFAINNRKEFITPITLFYAGVIIVNLSNISLINLVDSGKELKTYSYIIPKYINEASLIFCISNTFFSIGYNTNKQKFLPKINLEINSRRVLSIIFYFLLIENILFIFGAGINVRVNQIGKLFSLVNSIGILFYSRLWSTRKSRIYMVYALVLFSIETYLSLITSYLRFELILPTFYLFTGYFIGKNDVKYIFSYRIIPLVLILIVYSSSFNKLGSYRSNFIDVFSRRSETQNYHKALTQESTSSGLITRSSNLAQLTNIVKLVDKNNGPYGGLASQPILTAFIPRFLWPDKPKIQLGAWFAREIGLATVNDYGLSNNSINMTVAGELYLDFGWLGVIIGSYIFGGLISILWNSTLFYSSEFNLTGTIYGGYLIMISIGSYADLQIAVTLISTYLLFLLIKNLIIFFGKK